MLATDTTFDNKKMNYKLRTAEPTDETFLREMLYLAIFVPPGESRPPRSVLQEPTIARYVDFWGTRTGDSGLLALVDSAPVGAAWLRRFSASTPGYGFVDEQTPELSVAVLHAYQGYGIGSHLIKALLQGVYSVSLSCYPTNPAWRLYLSLGFRPLPDGRTMLRTKL